MRSYRRQRRCLSLAAAGVTLIGSFAYAQDTALNVPLSTTDLFTTSPTTTSDLTFINGTYTSPSAIQVSSSISTGTLDDLNTLQALTVTNAGSGTITLSSLANATPGSIPADLIYGSSGSSLTVNAPVVLGVAGGSFDIAGTAAIGGGISSGGSAYGFTKTGAGTLTLNGSATNTYTGATAINRGNLTLDFTSMGATPNLISASSPLQLGGGNLNIVGNSAGSTQTFASTAVQSGTSVISVGQTNANNPTLNLGAVTATVGGTVVFNGPVYSNATSSGATGTTPVAATGTINTTTAATGGFGGIGTVTGDFATVGLYDWAATSGASIVGGSQVSGFYTDFATGNGTLTGNVDFTANSSGSHNTDTPTSLRFNVPGAFAWSPTAVVATGGILVTPNVGAGNVTIGGVAGDFEPSRGGASSMVIWQNNILGFLVGNVNNTFNDAKSGAGTYIFTGIGTTQLNFNNTYTGQTYIEGSAMVYMAANYLGNPATGAAVNLNGGTVVAGATFALDNAGANAHPVVLGSNGGGLAATGVSVFTVDGKVSGAAGSGPLVIGIPASSSNGNTVGLLPGTGAGTANTTAVNATGTVVLSNTSNSYTGGTVLDSGILQLTSTSLSVLGTGGITLNGGTFQWASGNTTDISARPITLASTGTFDTQANTITLGNSVGNNGAGGFTKVGSGSLTLNGSNTFTGGVTVNAGTVAFGGANIYTGPTAINAGTLVLNGTAASLGNTAITVAGGATFAAKPGVTGGNIIVGTTGASLTLNSGASFSLADGFVDQLTLNSAGSGTASTILSLNGATLSFDVGATGASELVANNGTFASSGTNNISIASIGGTQPSSLTNIPILTVPNASGNVVLSDFNLMTTAITFGSTSYVASLSTNAADTTLYLNLTAASLSYYFAGGASGSFGNASNFVNGPTSATTETALPGAANNVFLTANTGFANATNSANITLNGSYTINSLTFTGTGTITPVTLGPGSGGTLTIQGANSFSDSNTSNNYNGGTGLVVEPGAAADTISANINLGSSQSWEIDNSPTSPLTVSGNIGSSTAGLSLTKTGTGKLILSGSNTYTGGTSVAAGILQLGAGASNALPANAPLNVSGGSLDLNGNNVTVSSLSDAGQSAGVVTDSLGGASLNVNNAIPTTFSGSITGGLALTYGGASTLTLSGSNSYTGMTTVNSGIVTAASNQPFGNPASATGGLTLNGSAIVDFTSSAPVIASLSSGSSTTSIVLGNSAAGGSPTSLTVNTSSANPLSFSGTISDLSPSYPAAIGSLTLAGTGSLTLNNTDTFFGTTTIGGTSTLIVGNPLALENSTLIYNNPTGTLSFGSQTAATLGGLNGSQPLALLNTGATAVTLTVGNNNGSNTYSGAMNGAGGSLVKAGTGTLTLSGLNSYSGSTTINAGNLTVTSTGAIGSGVTPANAGAIVFGDNGNGTLSGVINASSLTTNSNGLSAVTITGGSVNVSGTLSVDNDGGDAGGVVTITGGTVTAGSIIVGRTALNNGATIQTAGNTGDGIYVNGGTVVSNSTLYVGSTNPKTNSSANVRMDAGSITVAGTTYITVANTRFSVFDISGGTYNGAGGVQIGGVFGTADAEFLVRGGVSTTSGISFGDATQTAGSNVLELLGGSLYIGAGGIAENPNDVFPVTPIINFGGTTYATAPTLAATAPWTSPLNITLTNSSSGVAPILQASDASGNPWSIGLTGNLNGSGGLTIAGTGVVTLAPATGSNNTYTGLTNVSSGVLVSGVAGAIPTGNVMNVGLGATFVSDSQATVSSLASLNLNGNMIVHGGSLSQLTSQVAQGYNNGAWNGTSNTAGIPITSTAAAADTTYLHAIGVIQNDNGAGTATALYSTFEGQPVSDSDVLVKYTYFGDANLDGKVDGSDYSRIDNGSLNHLTGWFNGDFNYDGVINGSDYTLIDNAYNTQGAQLSSEVAAATAQIAVTSGSSAVPEPATLGLLGIGAVGLLGRRNRRHR